MVKRDGILARWPFLQALKGYSLTTLRHDLMGGLTVGMIAVPLSMALAINSGVSPQNGLYTTIVAGFLIALFGGSRFNVSGPTAAFVIILQPITNQYGVAGLLLASFMAGIILLLMGLFKLGRMVHFVPHPVTTGFSTGIAIVIAMTQLPDLLGAEPSTAMNDFLSRMEGIVGLFKEVSYVDLMLGIGTLLGLILLPRLIKRVPPHLIVLGIVALLGIWLKELGFQFRTIDSVFSYTAVDGTTATGIPSTLPTFSPPWNDEAGNSIFSWTIIQELLPSAFVIAILGAIESLLCAVVADGMKNTRHNPDAELVGQGIGNIVAPFFGGFAATGALARTAASIRAGAKTPIASIIHALFVLVTLLLLAPLLGYLPMAALGGMLLMVAWSMADLRYFKETLRMAPTQDRIILFTCLILTVLFDMVVAVMVGMILASLLFMARMTQMTQADFLLEGAACDDDASCDEEERRSPILHYEIRGPFFFGAARKALESFERLPHISQSFEVVIIDLSAVPLIDLTGLITFKAMLERLKGKGIRIIMVGLNSGTKETLGKAGLSPKKEEGIFWASDTAEARYLGEALLACETDEEALKLKER